MRLRPPQSTLNGEVHNWYRLRLGYPDQLVAAIIDDFQLGPNQSTLDPFCGAGTTLVECMKRGIPSVGIDANPSSCLAARVKTNWRIRSSELVALMADVEDRHESLARRVTYLMSDPTCQYLTAGGFVRRGWISMEALLDGVAVKKAIEELPTNRAYKDCLLLALIAEIVEGASNVKFGPELYCGKPRENADVLQGFCDRVQAMADDLDKVGRSEAAARAMVLHGDSRRCSSLLEPGQLFDSIICSPPYPTEHDYTRNSRLELAFLEFVSDRSSLRQVKQQMVRSHTKGIYASDRDRLFVHTNAMIQRLSRRLEAAVAGKEYGFARLYPRVLKEYFGGMKRHLLSVKRFLKPRAMCAYVVGDQASYLRTHIPTARILADVAAEAGFQVVGIRRWRTRRATATAKRLAENILLLRKS
jgi:hypothetical protein